MSTSSSPTVVLLVPGAWHAPDHYSQLLDGLKHEGFETVSQRNPSCDSTNPHETSSAGDASAIRQLIVSQIDKGYDVVVAMHSYGGCPGAAAAYGLSKTERQAAGRQGGVIGLIFICAFVANEGDSLIGKLPGGVRTEWMILHVSNLLGLPRSMMAKQERCSLMDRYSRKTQRTFSTTTCLPPVIRSQPASFVFSPMRPWTLRARRQLGNAPNSTVGDPICTVSKTKRFRIWRRRP